MYRNRFERILPWAGVLGGACWAAQLSVGAVGRNDTPGGAEVDVLTANAMANIVHDALLVLMAVAVVFFAASVRAALRATEPAEASASSVAFGGWILVAAALGQMAVSGFALSAAAADGDAAATRTIGYLAYPGWLAMMVGLAAAYLAMGIGGLRGRAFPSWLAIVTLTLGGLTLLGAIHIPPGGLLSYVVLPFWFVAASIVISRTQRREDRRSAAVATVTD